MSSRRSFLAGLASVRAFFAGFLGSLGWFVWAETQQNGGSCYGASHYAPSAVITFGVIIVLVVVSGQPMRRQRGSLLLGQGLAAAAWAALGLSLAIFFAAATSCSA